MAIVIAVAVGLGLAAPMLFSRAGFGQDWVNHLWYIWKAGISEGDSFRVSLFLHRPDGLFYPHYAFYGGTLYSLTGGISAILGQSPVVAYVLSWIGGIVAAASAWTWLARMAGLSWPWAIVPGLAFATSPYYLTLIYARGAWPEFIAVSTIPLVIASGFALLRSERVRARDAIVFTASTLVWFGSHNITMLWGLSYVVLLAALALVAIPEARQLLVRPQVVGRLASLAVPAALVNAWFIIPTLAYAGQTRIADYDNPTALRLTGYIVDSSNLLTLSRASAVHDAPGFVVALPVLILAWLVIGGVYSLIHHRHGIWTRALLVLVAVSVAIVALMESPSLIASLPGPFPFVQFSYRLISYVLFGVAGAVICLLVLAQSFGPRARRALHAGLLLSAAGSLALAIPQLVDAPRRIADRNLVFDARDQPPPTLYGLHDYDDVSLPAIAVPAGSPALEFDPRDVHDDVAMAPLEAGPANQLIASNLLGSPSLVKTSRLEIVGRDEGGHLVLQRPSQMTATTIVASGADRPPVVVGRILSLLAIIGAITAIALLTLRGRRARH